MKKKKNARNHRNPEPLVLSALKLLVKIPRAARNDLLRDLCPTCRRVLRA